LGRQTDAEKALNAKFASLGYTYVSWPSGPKITPPADAVNYSVATLYGQTVAAAVGYDAQKRALGLYQVTIRCPETGSGTSVAIDAAEAVVAAFPRGTTLPYPVAAPTVHVNVRDATITHLGNVTEEWYTVVVRIPFRMDV
jgi:hypothetical protein